MAKIICDALNIVRFHFPDDAILTQETVLVTSLDFNIGNPPVGEYTVYTSVTLPSDIKKKQYFYDGTNWIQGADLNNDML